MCKLCSVSMVDDSDEGGNASVEPSTPKCLKTEPAPWADDKVFSGNGAWSHRMSILLADLGNFLKHCGKCWVNKVNCFICSRI